MWSWKLWNLRLVSILPEPRALLTVMMALLTIQLAGDLSRVFTHSSSFPPSNRTMASEGGAESTAPGVTTLGTGSQTSVSCGLPLPWARPGPAGCCCAKTAADNANSIASVLQIESGRRVWNEKGLIGSPYSYHLLSCPAPGDTPAT